MIAIRHILFVVMARPLVVTHARCQRTAVVCGAFLSLALAHGGPAGEIWRSASGARGVPVSDATRIYAAIDHHRVAALDARSGALVWVRQTGDTHSPDTPSSLVPARSSSLLFVGDDEIVAIRREDGAVEWKFFPADGYVAGAYLSDESNGRLFAGSPAGRLYALDAATGRQTWSATVSTAPQTTAFEPVSDGRTVIVAYTTFTTAPAGGIAAYDVETGRLVWRRAFQPDARGLGAARAGGPVLAAGIAVVALNDGALRAFDVRSGRMRWSAPSPGRTFEASTHATGGDFRALTAAGTRVIAGSLRGDVTAYSLSTGEREWTFASPDEGSVAFHITADRDDVFVPYLSGVQICLRAGDGRERWRIGDQHNHYFWPPAVHGDRLFFAADRSVRAYRRP